MCITLHGAGASNKIKNGIGSNRPNMFLFSDNNLRMFVITLHTTMAVSECRLFLFRALFSFIIINSRDPCRTGITAHIRPVLSPYQAGVQR